ncbi:hypothetical protein L1987_78255 [Smallanthus sonchifolius]|uniref:Uncharacterized protein n=1 Tax=Smallanthus sonchifolius TaxID=185202 RepID=A0ACB8ZD79_9ASTR|nr:hypothetical protein L1987_78255 [Smallanthus sonchifolius]
MACPTYFMIQACFCKRTYLVNLRSHLFVELASHFVFQTSCIVTNHTCFFICGYLIIFMISSSPLKA